MVIHIHGMTDSEKKSFNEFIGEKKSNHSIRLIFKEFEKCNPDKTPSGLVKRLLTMPKSGDYRTFERFKRILFDFEISSRRLGHFKSEDHHTYIQTELRKKLMASQLIFGRNAIQTSIQTLHETYHKARKHEHIQLALDCALDLYKYYGFQGELILQDRWKAIVKRLENLNYLHQLISNKFEEIIFHPQCCELHAENEPKEGVGFLDNIPVLKLQSAKWMQEAVQIMIAGHAVEPVYILQKAITLRRKLRENPGMYPVYFKVAVAKIILESLWKLKRHSLILKGIHNLRGVKGLTVFQSIPILRFYLCYLLKRDYLHLITGILEHVYSEVIYQKFPAFMAFVNRIQWILYLRKKKYGSVLMAINREDNTSLIVCSSIEMQFRIIEIIALYKTGKKILVLDRLENLRKLIQRKSDLRKDKYCGLYIQVLKQGLEKTDHQLQLDFFVPAPLYDLRGEILDQLILCFPDLTKLYKVRQTNRVVYPINTVERLSRAAEERPRINHP